MRTRRRQGTVVVGVGAEEGRGAAVNFLAFSSQLSGPHVSLDDSDNGTCLCVHMTSDNGTCHLITVITVESSKTRFPTLCMPSVHRERGCFFLKTRRLMLVTWYLLRCSIVRPSLEYVRALNSAQKCPNSTCHAGNLAALATWQLWHLIKGAGGAKKVPKTKAAMCQTTISNHKKDEINYKIKVA